MYVDKKIWLRLAHRNTVVWEMAATAATAGAIWQVERAIRRQAPAAGPSGAPAAAARDKAAAQMATVTLSYLAKKALAGDFEPLCGSEGARFGAQVGDVWTMARCPQSPVALSVESAPDSPHRDSPSCPTS